jgi:hypothetical protein
LLLPYPTNRKSRDSGPEPTPPLETHEQIELAIAREDYLARRSTRHREEEAARRGAEREDFSLFERKFTFGCSVLLSIVSFAILLVALIGDGGGVWTVSSATGTVLGCLGVALKRPAPSPVD